MVVQWWKWMTGLFILCLPIVIYYYHHSPAIYKNLRFAFEGFFSLVETGSWEVHSNDMLKNMYVFPETLKTWIIGDGYFNGPTLMDPYYTGRSMGYFYMDTDVGYLRFIFYFGLLGLSLFAIYFCYLCTICMNRFRLHKMMFLLFLAANFIIWFKVSSDLFLVFALFLCVDQDENEAYENNIRTLQEAV